MHIYRRFQVRRVLDCGGPISVQIIVVGAGSYTRECSFGALSLLISIWMGMDAPGPVLRGDEGGEHAPFWLKICVLWLKLNQKGGYDNSVRHVRRLI